MPKENALIKTKINKRQESHFVYYSKFRENVSRNNNNETVFVTNNENEIRIPNLNNSQNSRDCYKTHLTFPSGIPDFP